MLLPERVSVSPPTRRSHPMEKKSELRWWVSSVSGGHGHRRCWPLAGPGCGGAKCRVKAQGGIRALLAAGKIIH